MTLFDLLCDHPFDEDEGVLFSVDGSMTLGETRRRVEELARTFDVGPGRAIAVQLPNGPELLCAMFAVWSREAVFVPVNDRMPAAEVDSILAATGACGIVDRNGFRRLDGAVERAVAPEELEAEAGARAAPMAIEDPRVAATPRRRRRSRRGRRNS